MFGIYTKKNNGHMHNNRYFGYVEGYVDGCERPITPFDPTQSINPAAQEPNRLCVQQLNVTSATTIDGSIITTDSFDFIPISGSHLYLTVNGLIIYPADGSIEVPTSAFYVTNSTGSVIRKKGTYQVNDVFRWNGSVAHYQLDTSDDIKLTYII